MFSVVHDGRCWRLADEDGQGPIFPDAEAAERRGRFLTTRANVQDVDAVLRIFGRDGELLGTWSAERFAPGALVHTLTLKAA